MSELTREDTGLGDEIYDLLFTDKRVTLIKAHNTVVMAWNLLDLKDEEIHSLIEKVDATHGMACAYSIATKDLSITTNLDLLEIEKMEGTNNEVTPKNGVHSLPTISTVARAKGA